MGTKVLYWGMKMTTHLKLVPEVKNEWSYSSVPSICHHGVDRDNFSFTVN